ncbi:MAG: T9SS type A sorting domain-containing protein [Bacteroidetes bacterium]|nr:T9SS type A sorting domain-containing protein [Bacteroidota bacterium]
MYYSAVLKKGVFILIILVIFATPDLSGQRTISVDATATPDSICVGASSQLQAVVTGGISPFHYVWTPPTGLNNTAIPDPLASPVVPTWYHLTVTDAGYNTASDSILVSIKPTPPTPGTISGPVTVCHDSAAFYSISAVNGATSYSWMAPAGATILSGQNTTSIQVQWGNAGGSISVIAGNFCGNSNPSVLPVNVTTQPAAPATIFGPSAVCNAATVVFSVDSVPGATSYFWTVPPEAQILSGQNSDSISVQWGPNPGTISVISVNPCGQSTPKTRVIGIETLPGPAGMITGKDTVCSNNETYSYSVPLIAGATSYAWSVPAGTTITSGAGTSTIIISVGPSAISSDISVQGKNTCGGGTASVKPIIVKICAGVPDPDSKAAISIYPNPAESSLNIVLNQEEKQTEISLLNASGQIVFRQVYGNRMPGTIHTIDVSGVSRGLYFVKLVSEQRVYVERVILQ